jgi:hypothetical protein
MYVQYLALTAFATSNSSVFGQKNTHVAANTYLRNMLLTSEYYPNAAVLFNTAKREFDWAVSVTVYAFFVLYSPSPMPNCFICFFF